MSESLRKSGILGAKGGAKLQCDKALARPRRLDVEMTAPPPLLRRRVEGLRPWRPAVRRDAPPQLHTWSRDHSLAQPGGRW
jgi:hypothetical protein